MRAAGKPVLLIVLLCTAIGVACYLFARSKSPGITTSASSGPPDSMPAQASASAHLVPPSQPEHLASPGAATTSAPAVPATAAAALLPFLVGSADAPSSIEPATVLRNLRNVISQYGSMF